MRGTVDAAEVKRSGNLLRKDRRWTYENQFLLYTTPDGAVKVEVFYQDETVWLTQKTLAELFGV